MKITAVLRSFFLFTLLLAITNGCNDDFFELTNPPEFPWQNINQLEMAVVTPYNLTFTSSWGSYWQNHHLIYDCMSDYIYLLPNTAADIPYSEMYFRTTDIRIGKADGIFNDIYQTIGTCHAALDFYKANDDLPFPNPTEKDLANLLRIKGELHFMKAFAYFTLVKTHAPSPVSGEFSTTEILPLREEFPKNIKEANEVVFGTARQVYDIILDELKKAKSLLPEKYLSGIHHPSYQYGRANRFAAAMLLMRVYFLLGEPDLALEEADYIISNSPYRLNQDPLEAWTHSDPAQGNEVIWYALYYDNIMNSVAKVFTSMTKCHYTAKGGGRDAGWSRCPWNQFCLSHNTSKYLGWMDDQLNVTQEAKRDKRYTQLYYRLEGNNGDNQADPKIYETQYAHIKKPYIWGDKYFRGADGQYTNVPVMRLAEVYLTRSYLRFKKNNLQGALADLNMVRQRAGLDPLSTITEEDIHRERLKELAFEGDRFFYLQALRKPIGTGDRESSAIIQQPYEGVYWKIPQLELDMHNSNKSAGSK